jgi:outer membrane immunogenic protein
MKKFLFAAVAFGASVFALIALPAMAADLAPFYRAPAPFPIAGWTGPYVGATMGGGWVDGNVAESATATICNPALVGCAGGPAYSNALVSAIPTSFGTSHAGFVAGGEFGYNWQMGAFVLGLEVDLSGSTISGGVLASGSSGVASIPGNTVGVAGSANEKVDYLGTVRARAGYLVMPSLLAYATAGFAYGGASSNTTLTEQVTGVCACGPSPSVAGSTSAPRAGWTAGGGLEYMFIPHWTVKAEYLYYDLGSVTYALPPLVQTTAGGTPYFAAASTSRVAFTGNIVRAGVNFGF